MGFKFMHIVSFKSKCRDCKQSGSHSKSLMSCHNFKLQDFIISVYKIIVIY